MLPWSFYFKTKHTSEHLPSAYLFSDKTLILPTGWTLRRSSHLFPLSWLRALKLLGYVSLSRHHWEVRATPNKRGAHERWKESVSIPVLSFKFSWRQMFLIQRWASVSLPLPSFQRPLFPMTRNSRVVYFCLSFLTASIQHIWAEATEEKSTTQTCIKNTTTVFLATAPLLG